MTRTDLPGSRANRVQSGVWPAMYAENRLKVKMLIQGGRSAALRARSLIAGCFAPQLFRSISPSQLLG